MEVTTGEETMDLCGHGKGNYPVNITDSLPPLSHEMKCTTPLIL